MKWLVIILVLWMNISSAQAQQPNVLSVLGDIKLDGHQYHQLDFTLDELQALPQAEINTITPWTTESHRYRGVDLVLWFNQLFESRRINSITLEALNNFSVTVDWSKIKSFTPVLAWQDNGKVMSRRDKGPLWLMLPFDRVPKLQQAEFLHFMAWQIRVIRVQSEPC